MDISNGRTRCVISLSKNRSTLAIKRSLTLGVGIMQSVKKKHTRMESAARQLSGPRRAAAAGRARRVSLVIDWRCLDATSGANRLTSLVLNRRCRNTYRYYRLWIYTSATVIALPALAIVGSLAWLLCASERFRLLPVRAHEPLLLYMYAALALQVSVGNVAFCVR